MNKKIFTKLIVIAVIVLMASSLVLAVPNNTPPPSSASSGTTATVPKPPVGGKSSGTATNAVDAKLVEILPGVKVTQFRAIEGGKNSYLNPDTLCADDSATNCWDLTDDFVIDIRGTLPANQLYSQGVRYENGIWTTPNGIQNVYSPDGRVIVANDEIVYLKNDGRTETLIEFTEDFNLANLQGQPTLRQGTPVVKYRNQQGQDRVIVGEANIPSSLYDRYESRIDYSQVSARDGDISSIPLTDARLEIETLNIGGTEVIDVKVTAFEEDSGLAGRQEQQFWYLPDGREFSAEDGWRRSGNELIGGDTRITFRQSGSNSVVVEETPGRITETTLRPNNIREVEIKDKINDEIKTSSIRAYNAQGDLVGDAELKENGDFLYARYYSDESGFLGLFSEGFNQLAAVCGVRDCLGDPAHADNYWVTTDEACHGSYSSCYGPNAQRLPGRWNAQESSNCDSRCKDAIAQKEESAFLRGETDAQRAIGGILGFRPGWEGLSSWILGDEFNQWRARSTAFFDQALVAEYIVPDAVCNYNENHIIQKNGEAALWIQLPGGATQHVSAITAEKSASVTPALCSEDFTCTQGVCGDEGICLDANDNPLLSTFYKVSWGVTAPRDEAFTPFIDENGVAVSFNIRLIGGEGTNSVYLYPADEEGSPNTLRLVNAESDRDTFIAYSPNTYTQACIVFGAPPKDRLGNTVNEICAPFVISESGQVNFANSARIQAQGSERVQDAGRKTNI